MVAVSYFGKDGLMVDVRRLFRPRDLFLHDGTAMRRIHVSTRIQGIVVATVAIATMLSLLATAQIVGVSAAIGDMIDRGAQVARMQREVAAMQADMAKIKAEAAAHASRIEARQAFLAAVLTGEGTPVVPAGKVAVSASAAAVVAPLAGVEKRQFELAAQARAVLDSRYAETAASLRKIGLPPQVVQGGMGGPYDPVDTSANPTTKTPTRPDPTFRALFQSWQRLDRLEQGVIAIPSQKPVDVMLLTSGFGVRSDPFRGGAAMHAGVDIPGPHGATIYATADGIVMRSERAGGYGNLVELDHGRGITTRYGHLSSSLVAPGQRVKRGQAIARMGSTGRSTGTHLHYEVRLDGHAVNPMPFLQSANYLAEMQSRAAASKARVAQGGPEQ